MCTGRRLTYQNGGHNTSDRERPNPSASRHRHESTHGGSGRECLGVGHALRVCKRQGSSRLGYFDRAAGASRSGRLEVYLKAPGTRCACSCILDVTTRFVTKPVNHAWSSDFDSDLSPEWLIGRACGSTSMACPKRQTYNT